MVNKLPHAERIRTSRETKILLYDSLMEKAESHVFRCRVSSNLERYNPKRKGWFRMSYL